MSSPRRIEHVRVLHRPKKDGLARAYNAGFDQALAADATTIIQIDADWSHPPGLLPTLVARLDAGADLVLGSRYVRGGGTQGWPLKRRIISRCGNLFAQLVLTLPYPDLTGAYKVWRAETLRAVDPASIDVSGYVFMIELVDRAHLLHARIAQVPFIFVERREGVSKMSGGIFFEAFRHVVKLRLDRIRGRARGQRPTRRPAPAESLTAQRYHRTGRPACPWRVLSNGDDRGGRAEDPDDMPALRVCALEDRPPSAVSAARTCDLARRSCRWPRHSEPAPKGDAKAPKSGRGLLRRKPADAAGPAGAPRRLPRRRPRLRRCSTCRPGPSATGPIMLPGTQTALPKEKPAPKEPAVVPKADTTMSFSERYRGTQYSNPDVERFLPPVKGAKTGRRWGRIVVVLLFVATLAAALAGSWFLFFSPQCPHRATRRSPTIGAAASGTPRPTPTPKPTIHGAIADEVEIAACLLLSEDAQRSARHRRPAHGRTGRWRAGPGRPRSGGSAAIEASRPSLPTLSSAAADAGTRGCLARRLRHRVGRPGPDGCRSPRCQGAQGRGQATGRDQGRP